MLPKYNREMESNLLSVEGKKQNRNKLGGGAQERVKLEQTLT